MARRRKQYTVEYPAAPMATLSVAMEDIIPFLEGLEDYELHYLANMIEYNFRQNPRRLWAGDVVTFVGNPVGKFLNTGDKVEVLEAYSRGDKNLWYIVKAPNGQRVKAARVHLIPDPLEVKMGGPAAMQNVKLPAPAKPYHAPKTTMNNVKMGKMKLRIRKKG